MTDDALWRRRFRAPRTTLPSWATHDPDRALYASNESGTWELYGWDRATDRKRQLTRRKEGTLRDRSTRRESASGGSTTRMATSSDAGWSSRLPVALQHKPRPSWAGRTTPAWSWVTASQSLAAPSRTARRSTSCATARSRCQIYHHAEQAWTGGLSADEKLLCLHHSEHGDSRHPALRVVDLDGNTVAELNDGPGLALHSRGFTQRPETSASLSCTSATTCRGRCIWWPRTGRDARLRISICPATWTPRGIPTARPC